VAASADFSAAAAERLATRCTWPELYQLAQQAQTAESLPETAPIQNIKPCQCCQMMTTAADDSTSIDNVLM